MFSFKSFILSGLTFRSLINFEFIFVYGVRECSNFCLLHVAVQFSQYHLLKRLSFFFLIIYLFILFMAVLGLHFCARAFSSCGKWEPLFIAVHGPFTVTASLVGEHRLQTRRLSNCGTRS